MSEGIEQFFITLEDWDFEYFNPQVGIAEPENKAYAMLFQTGNQGERINLERFYTLLEDPNINKLEALICQIQGRGRWSQEDPHSFGRVLEAICDASEKLANLKALFIGDVGQHEYRKSKLDVFDIRPILEALPNLELLQVRGRFNNYTLECEFLKHESLRTLIIETADISNENFGKICALDLPNLEFLELWGGRWQAEPLIIDHLDLVFSGQSFPNLAHLGLVSSDFGDSLVEEIVNSPMIEQLCVLDLSKGSLSDAGAEVLLKCPAINQLHTLNITKCCVFEEMVQQLLQLDCHVIADGQQWSEEIGCGGERYYELHE